MPSTETTTCIPVTTRTCATLDQADARVAHEAELMAQLRQRRTTLERYVFGTDRQLS